MRRIFAVLIGIPGILSTASAQGQAPQCQAALDAGCACAAPLRSVATTGFGQVVDMQGTVLVSREAGISDAVQGAPLSLGDRVVTGVNSEAQLLFAQNCPVPLSSQSMLTVSEIEGCACASVAKIDRTAGAFFTGSGNQNVALTAFLLSLTPALVAVANEIFNEDDETCDPELSWPEEGACEPDDLN